MQLLVSVATAADACAAVEGGADIIDAKDPSSGALGAVTLERLREIVEAVAGRRPLTAALGEAEDERALERDARAYAGAGAILVKIGLLGTTDTARSESLVSAAVRGVSGTADGRGGRGIRRHAGDGGPFSTQPSSRSPREPAHTAC